MTAGTPTPSYAAPQTARPGTAATAAADPGHAVEVTHGVLRQPAAPALDVGGDRPSRHADGLARGRPARARPAPRRSAGAAASSPCRPSEVRRCRRPSAAPASRTQSHLANENVDALIDRPSTGGTRNPLLPPRWSTAAAGKASVTIAIEAYSTSASSAAAAGASSDEQPAGRSGGRREDDGVGRDLLGRRGGPDDQREPGLGPPELAHRGVGPDVEPRGERLRQAGPSRRPARRRPAS